MRHRQTGGLADVHACTHTHTHIHTHTHTHTHACTHTLLFLVPRFLCSENGDFQAMDHQKLLKAISLMDGLVDAHLELNMNVIDMVNGVINTCFLMMYKDLVRLYQVYNDAMISLLGGGGGVERRGREVKDGRKRKGDEEEREGKVEGEGGREREGRKGEGRKRVDKDGAREANGGKCVSIECLAYFDRVGCVWFRTCSW